MSEMEPQQPKQDPTSSLASGWSVSKPPASSAQSPFAGAKLPALQPERGIVAEWNRVLEPYLRQYGELWEMHVDYYEEIQPKVEAYLRSVGDREVLEAYRVIAKTSGMIGRDVPSVAVGYSAMKIMSERLPHLIDNAFKEKGRFKMHAEAYRLMDDLLSGYQKFTGVAKDLTFMQRLKHAAAGAVLFCGFQLATSPDIKKMMIKTCEDYPAMLVPTYAKLLGIEHVA